MKIPLKRRIRVSVTLDADAVNPDVRKAVSSYLVDRLELTAGKHGAVIDWNRTYFMEREPRRGQQKFIAKGVVL